MVTLFLIFLGIFAYWWWKDYRAGKLTFQQKDGGK